MWRTDSLEKTLMLGKIEGRRRRWQKMSWLDGITDLMDVSLSQLQEMVKMVCCSPWGLKKSGMTEWLNNENKIALELFQSPDWGLIKHLPTKGSPKDSAARRLAGKEACGPPSHSSHSSPKTESFQGLDLASPLPCWVHRSWNRDTWD